MDKADNIENAIGLLYNIRDNKEAEKTNFRLLLLHIEMLKKQILES